MLNYRYNRYAILQRKAETAVLALRWRIVYLM
jgi:hypothetical protein